MLIVNVRCKRCGGNLYIERNIEGDTLKCLACGFERDIPVEVKPVVNITQEVIKVVMPGTVEKTPGQLFYEKHAAEVNLSTPWRDLAQSQRERYDRKAAGHWTRKQTVKKETKVVKSGTKAAKSETAVLPPWSEIKNESEAVKIAWLEAMSCIKS